jgi:hypothetical protein
LKKSALTEARFEVLMAVMLQMHVFWQWCWRFMFSGDVAEESCLLAVLLEIHIF